MHLLTIASHKKKYTILPPNLSKLMLIVIVMSEMFQQCLQERNGKRALYKKPMMQLWASACGDWHWMVLKAHNFVFCNWLVMSSKEKMIRRIFFEAGFSNVPTIKKKKIVMFPQIYFNRSHHAVELQRTFKLQLFEVLQSQEGGVQIGDKLWTVLHMFCIYTWNFPFSTFSCVLWNQDIIASKNAFYVTMMKDRMS